MFPDWFNMHFLSYYFIPKECLRLLFRLFGSDLFEKLGEDSAEQMEYED